MSEEKTELLRQSLEVCLQALCTIQEIAEHGINDGAAGHSPLWQIEADARAAIAAVEHPRFRAQLSVSIQGGWLIAFDRMQKAVNATAREKGWYDEPTQEDGTSIALMHSELSEALESIRNGSPPDKHLSDFSSTVVELADLIIRVMNYAEDRGHPLGLAVLTKHRYNSTRPHKHGGKAF